MTGLLDAVLEAHGGLDRWQRFSTIEATIVSGGMLWEIKVQPPSAPRVGPYLTLMRGSHSRKKTFGGPSGRWRSSNSVRAPGRSGSARAPVAAS
jgi:hypothetical protein